MNRDQMQQSRAESKYLVTEETAREIRNYGWSYLVPDPYSAKQRDLCYPVHSLYLDSDALHSYWATVRRKERRFKLRIRFYNDNPETPAFVEIKHRVDGHTFKRRCEVPREKLNLCLAGDIPPASDPSPDDPLQSAVLQEFVEKARSLRAKPKLLVAYRREAYVSRDNSVRLTLDRDVRSVSMAELRLSTQLSNPIALCGNAVVLELKCSAGTPAWAVDMIRRFRLRQRQFAKYVTGIGQHGFTRKID